MIGKVQHPTRLDAFYMYERIDVDRGGIVSKRDTSWD